MPSSDYDINEQIGHLKRIREEKEANQREQQLAKDRAINVDDLSARFHSVGEVQLPLPTLLSEMMINRRFGSIEKVNFDDIAQLGAVIYFLENGSDATMANISSEQLNAAIYERIGNIELHQKEAYQECLLQIYLAVKKKSNLYQIQFIRNFLENLPVPDSAAAGAKH